MLYIGDGSDNCNVGKVGKIGKISHFSAVDDGSFKGNIGKISNFGAIYMQRQQQW